MLATLRNIFAPQTVAQTMQTLPPLETTIMDMFFKNRPVHNSPMIGKTELTKITRTIPLVRRDGTPISLDGDTFQGEFIAPIPIKPSISVSASELNDLRVFLGNQGAVENWRKNKIDDLRRAIRDTCEGMCSVVLTTGKVSWPVQIAPGHTQKWEVDYGALHTYTPSAKLTANSKLSDIYKILRAMELKIRQAGVGGGKVEFYAGSDVAAVFIDIADAQRTTTDKKPVSIDLGQGQVFVGKYVITFIDETYPEPLKGEWIPKLDPKTLMAVATDSPGNVWYCSIDSISANNAAVPLHIVPVPKDDDSGISLIAQSKPLPARNSKATCLSVVVN